MIEVNPAPRIQQHARRCRGQQAVEPIKILGFLCQKPAVFQVVSGAVGSAGGCASSRIEWRIESDTDDDDMATVAVGDEGFGDRFRPCDRRLGAVGGV